MSTVGKSNRGRKPTLSASDKKRNRRHTLANYQKTRINVGHQHDRWMKLKAALRLETHAEVAKVLLDIMASKQVVHCPPFCYVDCKAQHHPILLALFNVRGNKPDKDFIGLEAVMKRYEQLGEWDKDANIPDPNPDYRYPLLHWAASLGETLVVKWLLYDKKCRPGNQWSENGDTVLHRMIDRLIDNTKLSNKQIPKIIKEIMPHFKCNLVMKNKEGNTPLHLCCAPLQQISKAKRQYYTEWIHSMIELMKDHPMTLWNIAVNSQNNDGDTPLHILAEFSNNFGLIKDVLESDCKETFIKFGLQNNKKMTVLETAIKHGNVKTSSYLNKCMYLHKLPGSILRIDEEVKSVRHSPRILKHQKKGEKEEQLSSEDKNKSSRKISSNNSSPEQCKPPTKKKMKSDDMVEKTVAKQTLVTGAGGNVCEEKTPAGNDRQGAMTTTAGNGAHIAGTSLSTPDNGSSNNSTDNPVQAFMGYPKIVISQKKGVMQYAVLPKSQGIVLNNTTNNAIGSVQTGITPSNCLNKTNITSISSQPLVMNSPQFNATFTTPAIHGIPTSQISLQKSPNVPVVVQTASLPCSVPVKPSVKIGEDGLRILAIKPAVPNSGQQNSTNLVSSICKQKEDMSRNFTLIKPRPVVSTHQSVTISLSQPLNVAVPIFSNTMQSESQRPIDHFKKSNSTNINSASLSSSSLAPVSVLNTTGPISSILSPAATISSTTSPFPQQKRKYTSLVSSSSQETSMKYIKIEDDESLEVTSVSPSVTPPSDNLIHSSVSDSELQQEETKHNTESLPSPSPLSTVGSVDSDHGKTGRGILSYLSICSENTKKEFLDKLMKDKEKYSLEKDNIEQMYTEICDKKVKKIEKVKRKTEAVTFHLKKVVEIQDELYKLNEDMNAITKLESELTKLKHSVKKKLETCENAVSDFTMLS